MKAFRHLLLFTLLGVLPGIVAAQPALPEPALEHTLLWEITGNGLTHPSYLFGTIHRRDARAFHLADSVLIALASCDAFAGELDLDAAMRDFIENYYLTDDGRERLSRLIRGDTSEVRSGAHVAVDSAETTGTARAAGDTIGVRDEPGPVGVSKPEISAALKADSAGHGAAHENEIAWATPDSTDEPVETSGGPSTTQPNRFRTEGRWRYVTQRGTDLFGSADQVNPGDKPTVIDAYLYGVAKSLGKPTLGLETITEQLRASGSSTEPFSFFEALRRTRRRRTMIGARNPEQELVDAYSKHDLPRLYNLLRESMSARAMKRMIVNRNHTMAERAGRLMAERSLFIAVGSGHLPGPEGMIELFRDAGYTVRPMMPTFRNYITGTVGVPPATSAWHTLSSAEGAFAVEMPMEPIAFPGDTGDPMESRTQLFAWPDLSSGIFYAAGYSDADLSDALSDESELLDRAAANTISSDDVTEPPEVATVELAGRTGREVTYTNNEGRRGRKRYVMRGRRLYQMGVVTVPGREHSADAERFFNSFTMLPLAPPEWRTHLGAEDGFSAQFPGALHIVHDSDMQRLFASGTWYSSHDRGAGTMLQMSSATLSPYYRAKDSAALYDDARNYFAPYGDTLGAPRTIVQDGVRGMEFTIADNRGEPGLTMRLFLHAGRMYVQEFAVPRDSMLAGVVERFTDSLRFTAVESAGDPFADKGKRLLDDIEAGLMSRDRSFFMKAHGVQLDTTHLSRMEELLSRKWPDDDSYTGVRALLLSNIGLIRDSGSVTFIGGLYPSIAWHESLRYAAMRALVTIGTREAMTALNAIIRDEAAKGEDLSVPISYVESTGRHLDLFFPWLLERPMSGESLDAVYLLTRVALDSGVIKREMLRPHAAAILEDCKRTLVAIRNAPRGSADDEDEETYNRLASAWKLERRLQVLAGLMRYLDATPTTVMLLNRMAASTEPMTQLAAVAALVRLHRPAPRGVVARLAAMPEYRTGLYAVLRDAGDLTSMPAKYRTQQSIAEALLVQWVVDVSDGDSVSRIECIDIRPIADGERTGRLFVFTFSVGDDESTYIGISGLQPTDGVTIAPDADLVYSAFEEHEKRSLDEHVVRLLKEWRAAR